MWTLPLYNISLTPASRRSMKSGSYLVLLISDPQLHLTEITIKISALAAHAPSNTPSLNRASLMSMSKPTSLKLETRRGTSLLKSCIWNYRQLITFEDPFWRVEVQAYSNIARGTTSWSWSVIDGSLFERLTFLPLSEDICFIVDNPLVYDHMSTTVGHGPERWIRLQVYIIVNLKSWGVDGARSEPCLLYISL